jgi:hypothetical protein
MPRAPTLEFRGEKAGNSAHRTPAAGARTTWQDCYVNGISMRKSSELETSPDRPPAVFEATRA